jgi:uncharacterized membrane protein
MKKTPVFLLAAFGLVLSLVLEALHARAYLAPTASSFCTVGERLDCTSVALSRYSVILGVPVPLWGAAGFLAILGAAQRNSRWLLVLTGVASLASLALLAIEAFAIGALCLLCEAIHVASFVLFALAWRARASLSPGFANRSDLLTVFAPPAGVLVALVLFVPRYWGAFGWKGDLPFSQGKTPEGYPWIGATAPTVTLHEFTDYRCAHCKAAHARNLMRLAKHPNHLRIVRRQFPRMRCPKRPNFGCVVIRMAYCAEEQGKFWQADRWLFEHATSAVHVDPDALAREVGIDSGKLQACLGRPDLALRAAAEAQIGLERHFSATPTFVVNERVVPESALDGLIAGAR